MTYQKWDIVYPLRYPESIQCSSCGRHFTISPQQGCTHCGFSNHVSNILVKIRPMILWVDQSRWYQSMTFGIPLSTTKWFSDDLNHAIGVSDCVFNDRKYEKAMRAVLCQATRADGNVFQGSHFVGRLTDSVVRQEIENKLFKWLFG